MYFDGGAPRLLQEDGRGPAVCVMPAGPPRAPSEIGYICLESKSCRHQPRRHQHGEVVSMLMVSEITQGMKVDEGRTAKPRVS